MATVSAPKWYHRLSELPALDDASLEAIGLRPYERTTVTQRSGDRGLFGFKSGASFIVDRRVLPSRWHQPGGMEGVTGWRSKLFSREVGVRDWYGATRGEEYDTFPPQSHRRSYGDGTVFVDRLTNAETGEIFEARAREKVRGAWRSYVFERNVKARPTGYHGLKQSCASCHEASDGPGTGGYGTAIVPGDDTVFSRALPLESRNGGFGGGVR